MKEEKKTVIRRVYRNSSEIAQCNVCEWNGTGTKEATKHCKNTGHSTVCETNIVYYYELI